MKQIVNKKYFLGLFLLSVFLMVGIVSVTNGQTFIGSSEGSEHIVRLHSLFLWNGPGDSSVSVKVNTGDDFLSISGGLAVGSNHFVAQNAVYSAIGGGKENKLSGVGNGIVGGELNKVDGKYSLIGGGKNNEINAENSVIGGGSGNIVEGYNSVIVGGNGNYIDINATNSVILGGQGNKAKGENSLVLGQNAEGNTGSFAWSAKVSNPNSARIDTKSGVLIGTYTPINGVKLVISGAVSLSGQSSLGSGVGGEIKVVSGCIYAYDGTGWQVMGKSSRQRCAGEIKACQFGETLLYQGDTVDAYTNFWSSNSCSSIKVTVMCSDGNLVNSDNETGTYYPYCYEIGGSNGGNGGGSNGGNGGGDNSKCDINRDGSVTIADQSFFENKCDILKISRPEVDVCDLNGDGSVNVSDKSTFYDVCISMIL